MYNFGELANVHKTNLLNNYLDKEAHVRYDEFVKCPNSSYQTGNFWHWIKSFWNWGYPTHLCSQGTAHKWQSCAGSCNQQKILWGYGQLEQTDLWKLRQRAEILAVQIQFRQIEELYLTLAKKASAFNSWFENLEEDMTDPVRCNSIKVPLRLMKLRDVHLIEDLGAILEAKLILDNWYTEHSIVGVAQQQHQLNHLGMCIHHNIEQQVRNQSGVSEDAFKEFSKLLGFISTSLDSVSDEF